jgi:transcriptional regulator with XRE-family HTH domain
VRLSNAVGDTIRLLRTDRSLTLREVSERSKVSLGHLSEIEMGKKNASNEVLEAIAVGLDLSTTELIGEVHDYLKIYDYLKEN